MLAKALSEFDIDAIYSSDLQRAYDTAKIVAKERRIAVKKEPGIKERCYGAWEGLHFDRIRKEFPSIYKIWMDRPQRAKIPRAEALKALQKRAISAVNKILARHKGKTVLVVAHGGTNRTILFNYLGIPLDNFWRVKQDNCCTNIVSFNKETGKPKLLLMNFTPLAGKKLGGSTSGTY